MTFYGFNPADGATVALGIAPVFYVDTIDDLETVDIVVLVNGVETSWDLYQIDSTNWRIRYLLTEELFHGLEYVVKAQVGDDKVSWSFHTEVGVSIRSDYLAEYRRSMKTQGIANQLSESTLARQDENSFFQQVVNPFGLKIEEMIKELRIEANNHFLPLMNLDSLNKLYRYILAEESFHHTHIQNGDALYLTPKVVVTAGINELDVTAVPSNSLKALVYDLVPTRISGVIATPLFFNEILAPTYLIDFPVTEFRRVAYPNKLYIQTANGTQYVGQIGPKIVPFTLILEGKDALGYEQEERIVFLRDQILATKNDWSEITKLSVTGDFNSTCRVSIYCQPPKGSLVRDPFQIYTAPDFENQLYWGHTIEDGVSILTENALPTRDLAEIVRDLPQEFVYRRSVLGDVDGDPVQLQDLTVGNDWIYGVDHEYVYLYHKLRTWPNTKKLGNNQDVDYYIDIEGATYTFVPGDTAEVNIEHARATKVPLSYRVWIDKPDGTIEKVTPDWVKNESPGSYVHNFPSFSYLFDAYGTYVFNCEILYIDGTIEKTQKLTYVELRKALAQYKLTGKLWTLATPSEKRIFYGSDQRVYVLDGSSLLYRLIFFKDYMILSFGTDEIFFVEQYDGVEVDLDGNL